MALDVTLYSISGSCSDAVAALCAHLGLRADIRLRKDFDAALTAINPERTVPTIVTGDGVVLTETLAILNHLARSHAAELLGRGGLERARNEEMCSFVATGVYSAFLLRFRPDRYAEGEAAQAAVKAKSGAAIELALDGLQARIAGNTFAVGESLTTSDFFLLVMMNWAERVDPNLLRQRPPLQAYWQRLRRMPFYAKAFQVAAA